MNEPKKGGSTTGKPSVLSDKESFSETESAEKLKQMGNKGSSSPPKPQTPQDG